MSAELMKRARGEVVAQLGEVFQEVEQTENGAYAGYANTSLGRVFVFIPSLIIGGGRELCTDEEWERTCAHAEKLAAKIGREREEL